MTGWVSICIFGLAWVIAGHGSSEVADWAKSFGRRSWEVGGTGLGAWVLAFEASGVREVVLLQGGFAWGVGLTVSAKTEPSSGTTNLFGDTGMCGFIPIGKKGGVEAEGGSEVKNSITPDSFCTEV